MTMSHSTVGLPLALFLGTILVQVSPAQAAFYKCVDASGSTSYSQMPCEAEHESRDLEAIAGSRAKADCRIARRFIAGAARSMKAGQNSSLVFDRFGGLDSLSPSAIGMINYVYTFKHNRDANAERVTALGTMQCESGSFGSSACSVFPTSFIDNLGGCEAAATGSRAAGFRSPSHESIDGARPEDAESSGDVQFPYAAPAVASESATIDCRAMVRDNIASLRDQMRAASSAQQQNALRERYRALSNRLSRC